MDCKQCLQATCFSQSILFIHWNFLLVVLWPSLAVIIPQMALGILVASKASATSSTLLQRSSAALRKASYRRNSSNSNSSGSSPSVGTWDRSDTDGSTVRSSWVYVEMDNVEEEVPLHPFYPQALSLETKIDLFRWRSKRCSVSSCESSCTDTRSLTHSLSRLSFIDTVSNELWKENPDRDSYNTFSVSEEELTRIIKYLESQLDGGQCITQTSETSADPIINCNNNDLKEVVSPTVTFILDTYCNMYLFG